MKKTAVLLYMLLSIAVLTSCGKNKKIEVYGNRADSEETKTVQETENATEKDSAPSDHILKYSIGSKNRVKKPGGYVGTKEITRGDPHYGWELGQFFISGYTTNTKDTEGNLVFLKKSLLAYG